MATTMKNKLFHQFKQSDYILFNVNIAFADSLNGNLLSFYRDFKESWNNLQPDPYLVEEGTFRLRRYAVVKWQRSILQVMTAEAHFQSKHYNSLYGGVNRVFAAITPAILNSVFLRLLIQRTISLFDVEATFAWRVQCHQFRIKTSLTEVGQPTPEGIHQDGADYVFIMLLERQCIKGGVSELFDNNKEHIVSTMLKREGDAILLNDKVLWHRVTEIRPDKQSVQGYRDVLVLTFHRLLNISSE